MNPTSSNIQLIRLPTHNDDRGSFIKVFNSTNNFLQHFAVKQINYVTNNINTLRGLHYQTGEHAESKFFRVVNGAIQLVCFCIDNTNKEFGKSVSTILNTVDKGVLVPRGYATGYLVLADNTNVLYLSDNEYDITSEKGIRWDDPALKITWNLKNPEISTKDYSWPSYK